MLSISLSVVNEPVWLQAVGLRLISTVAARRAFRLAVLRGAHCREWKACAGGGFADGVGLLLMQRLLGAYLVHFRAAPLFMGRLPRCRSCWCGSTCRGSWCCSVRWWRRCCRSGLPAGALPASGRLYLYAALLMLPELVERSGTGGCDWGCLVPGVRRASRCGRSAGEKLASGPDRGCAARDGGWLLARAAEGQAGGGGAAVWMGCPLTIEDGIRWNAGRGICLMRHCSPGWSAAADRSLASLRGVPWSIRGRGRSRTGRVRRRGLHVEAEQAPWAM